MKIRLFLLSLFCALAINQAAQAQTSAVTYQGRLENGGQPANSSYDFEFKLYDALASGNLLETQTRSNVAVADGLFNVQLNFAPTLFDGTNRFLEISVRTAGAPGGYQQLLPRQSFTSAPYAIRSLTATNALQVGGIDASQFVLTSDARLSDARNPNPNSPNYIQNSTTPQATSNFNVSGNGTVGGTLSGNIVSATTQFNLGANRFLFGNNSSLALGINAGNVNGYIGGDNTIVGNGAGGGISQIGGGQNSIFGREAGTDINHGSGNSYFGYRAGFINEGGNNSFFGSNTGDNMSSGSANTFIGASSGGSTNNASSNTFIGGFTGTTNTTGSNNTLLGTFSDVASADLEYATAIGAGAVVGLSNTVLIGRIGGSDRVQIPGQLQLVSLATGGVTNLCRTATTFIATCSSSLRYKTGVQTFTDGLNIVRRLRPITFNWIEDGSRDVGFAAEEVEEIEPLLVTRNEKDEIEGVKYAQITTVLVNALNEQQKQIDEQKQIITAQKEKLAITETELTLQKSEHTALKNLVCSQNPTAELCKPKEQ